jgi:hypothetical protein
MREGTSQGSGEASGVLRKQPGKDSLAYPFPPNSCQEHELRDSTFPTVTEFQEGRRKVRQLRSRVVLPDCAWTDPKI